MSFITGLGTAVPPTSFTQQDCWQALERNRDPAITPRSRAFLRGILNHDNGIERRSLALDTLDESFVIDPDTLHRRFTTHAPKLASTAAERALTAAGLRREQVDAVVISTCTGYLCPGLTSYVGEALGLRKDAFALDLVGQGCGAALPNLRTADALLRSGDHAHVLSVCVEVCSAAMYLDEDMGVLVSACIFGDGAAAAVMSREPREGARRVRWSGAASLTEPAHRDALRFEQRNGLLRNVLTLPVPGLAAHHAKLVLDDALRERSLRQDDIDAWILHAGGRRVLEEVRAKLELEPAQTRESADILRRYGNLSSPFVLFVLDEALRNGTPGGRWWMSSFGAGFSCHGALLDVA